MRRYCGTGGVLHWARSWVTYLLPKAPVMSHHRWSFGRMVNLPPLVRKSDFLSRSPYLKYIFLDADLDRIIKKVESIRYLDFKRNYRKKEAESRRKIETRFLHTSRRSVTLENRSPKSNVSNQQSPQSSLPALISGSCKAVRQISSSSTTQLGFTPENRSLKSNGSS